MKTTTIGGALLIASTILIACLNYLLSITLSWLLTPAQYGAIGVSQSLIFIGSWFLIAGFPWVAAQALAKRKTEEIEQLYPLLNGVLWANSALGLLVAGALWLAVQLDWLPLAAEYKTLVGWVAVVIVLLAIRLAITAVLQGRLQFAQLSLVTMIEVLGQVSTALFLVYAGYGVAGALTGFTTGTAISLVAAVWFTRNLPFWRQLRPQLNLLSELRPAIPLLLANLSGVLLVNVDLLALRFLIVGQDELVGQYQAVAVLARIPYYISQSVNTIIFPLLARHEPNSAQANQLSRQAFTLVTSLVLSLCLILIAAPEATIAFFFPPLYNTAAATLRLSALAMSMIILAQTLATICQARNQSWLAAKLLPFAALVQMLAALWLIPRYQFRGAALSSCIAGALALIGMLLLSQHTFAGLLHSAQFHWLRQAGAFLLLGSICAALPMLGRVSTALWMAAALLVYVAALHFLRLVDLAGLPGLAALRFRLAKIKGVA